MLGDVANELVDWFNAVDATYHLDLRELNELNFARFDAKLEQRLAQVRAALSTQIVDGLAAVETKLVRWMVGLWAAVTPTHPSLVVALAVLAIRS